MQKSISVSSNYIGIELSNEQGGNFIEYLICRNDRLPCKHTSGFAILPHKDRHFQSVQIRASQDGDKNPSNCPLIGSIPYTVPNSFPKNENFSVEVKIEMDLEGLISVEITHENEILCSVSKKNGYNSNIAYETLNARLNAAVVRGFLVDQNDESETELSSKRQPYLAALLATVPKDAEYEKKVENLTALSHEFRQRLADELAPALNAKVQTIPHDDLDGMKKVAEFVNTELQRFGLAAKCPKTGRPALLKATTGNRPGQGSFYFEVYIDGKRKTPSWSDTLPQLTLVDANPGIEPETPWQDTVGPKSSRTGRKLT